MVLGYVIIDVNYRNELKKSGFGEKLVVVFYIFVSFIILVVGIV